MVEVIKNIVAIGTFVVSVMSYFTVYRYSARMTAASFTYWSQLRIRLIRINTMLREEYLNNMYQPEEIRDFNGDLPSDFELSEFYKLLTECEEYIRHTTQDQLPAYTGWSDDMKNLQKFISDAICNDIREPQKYYITCSEEEPKTPKEYFELVRPSIERIILGIDMEQRRIENRIFIFRDLPQKFKKFRKSIHYKICKETNSGE